MYQCNMPLITRMCHCILSPPFSAMTPEYKGSTTITIAGNTKYHDLYARRIGLRRNANSIGTSVNHTDRDLVHFKLLQSFRDLDSFPRPQESSSDSEALPGSKANDLSLLHAAAPALPNRRIKWERAKPNLGIILRKPKQQGHPAFVCSHLQHRLSNPGMHS